MGEKGNVAAVTDTAMGLPGRVLDTGTQVAGEMANAMKQGATGAATAVVAAVVTDQIQTAREQSAVTGAAGAAVPVDDPGESPDPYPPRT
jgi:hypothetical protein